MKRNLFICPLQYYKNISRFVYLSINKSIYNIFDIIDIWGLPQKDADKFLFYKLLRIKPLASGTAS